MKLVPMKKSAIPKKSRKESPYRKLLEQFVESGQEAARVDGMTKKMNTVVSQLRRYVKQGDLPIKVRTAEGAVYLVRE